MNACYTAGAPDICRDYLEGNLGQEDEFVSLKEALCSVHIDRVGDLVCQVVHPFPGVLAGDGTLDGFLKDPVEGLRKIPTGISMWLMGSCQQHES